MSSSFSIDNQLRVANEYEQKAYRFGKSGNMKQADKYARLAAEIYERVSRLSKRTSYR